MSNLFLPFLFASSEEFIIGNRCSRATITQFLDKVKKEKKYLEKVLIEQGYSKGTILENPTALTYEKWNSGMGFAVPLFTIVSSAVYKYVGVGHNYSGDVNTAGSEKPIANWKNGLFYVSDENVLRKLKDFELAEDLPGGIGWGRVAEITRKDLQIIINRGKELDSDG